METNKKIEDDKATLNWISVKERLPLETGWYRIKTKTGNTTPVPLSTNMKGQLIWVVPDSSIITHWLETDKTTLNTK